MSFNDQWQVVYGRVINNLFIKELLGRKKIKMKRPQDKDFFLFVYHHVANTILQQLSFYNRSGKWS
jgi:hypothetical protein